MEEFKLYAFENWRADRGRPNVARVPLPSMVDYGESANKTERDRDAFENSQRVCSAIAFNLNH